MDFAALKAATLDRVGLPSTDGLATSTTLGLAVNAAVQKIGTKRVWPWLYDEQTADTTAGTSELALPVAALKVHFLSIGSDVLDRRQRADLVRFNVAGLVGQPNRWAMKGVGSVILAPIPDNVFTVNFGLTLIEPALSADGDTPLLPEQFHDFAVVLAARYIALRRKDYEMVTLFAGEVQDGRESLDRAADASNVPFPIRTRQDWTI